MGKVVVSIAWLVTIHMMTIRPVLLVVLAHTAIKFFNLRMSRAKHACRAGTPRRKVSLVRTIATNARRERKTHTKVPLWVTIVQIVRPIQNQKSKAPLNAFLVVLVKNQRKTVLNAVHVMSVRQALVQMVRAINVKPVGSVPTAWIRPRVNIVQLVLVKVTKGKHRVWNAARVNSTMLLVRWNANCV
jgi:hypothetical protein